MPELPITPAGERQMAALRWIASIAGEDQDHRDGWCRWGIPEGDPWTWDDYRPLVGAGLVERRETWWDVLLRLTTEGWAALGRSHVVG
jgi:hypothetical protein